MKRYNIFNKGHKGLRVVLCETVIALQQNDFTNDETTNELLGQINNVVKIFDAHNLTEDKWVLPAIENYEPSVAVTFKQEHVQNEACGGWLQQLTRIFASAENTQQKHETGKSLSDGFLDYMAFNLCHMAKEEEIINALLWRYYSDTEIQHIERKIVSDFRPEEATRYSRILMRGLNNEEIIQWLKSAEINAPEDVFKNLFAAAQNELPANRFHEVVEGITEGAMLV